MKLYNFLLLFIFSCAILFVSAICDISAAVDHAGPYTAEAIGERVDGFNNNRLNVRLVGRVRSDVRSMNGTFEIKLSRELPSGWNQIGYLDHMITNNGPIDGHFFEKVEKRLPREEYACSVDVTVSGQSTNGTYYSAYADVYVGPMPPPPPPQEATDSPPPPTGISPVDPSDTPSPGETHEYRLITEVPFYFVNWYVKTPWDTSERGTLEEYDPGDGTINESTFSYTFPSGVMHTGDFLITAVYYLWSSDSSEHEETYTVTVSLD